MASRNIVEIDEAKCNGCGLCVTSCAEGAIRIVNGKARLVSDVYCDGLGACLGDCPEGAIRIVQREAAPFDEAAVKAHLASQAPKPVAAHVCPGSRPRTLTTAAHGGCPGSRILDLAPAKPAPAASPAASQLGNWPVQLTLAAPHAPCFQGADLLLVADCVPFAYASFHQDILRGQPVIIACPKLDNAQAHADKLAAILAQAQPRSLTVVHMEVPCCMGLVRIAQAALQLAGSPLALHTMVIGIRGNLIADGRPA